MPSASRACRYCSGGVQPRLKRAALVRYDVLQDKSTDMNTERGEDREDLKQAPVFHYAKLPNAQDCFGA